MKTLDNKMWEKFHEFVHEIVPNMQYYHHLRELEQAYRVMKEENCGIDGVYFYIGNSYEPGGVTLEISLHHVPEKVNLAIQQAIVREVESVFEHVKKNILYPKIAKLMEQEGIRRLTK